MTVNSLFHPSLARRLAIADAVDDHQPRSMPSAGAQSSTRPHSPVHFAKRITVALAIVVSLLAFPSMVPWMIAAWLLWYTWLIIRQQPAWFPLITCFVILIIKGIGLPASGWILATGFCLRAGLEWIGPIQQQLAPAKIRISISVVLWILYGWFCVEWTPWIDRSNLVVDPSRPVVCLGDSLTSYGYPEQLASRLSIPVVNMGQDGIATDEGLKRLPELLALNPQAVVIELGGHDYLAGKSRGATLRNLEQMITACRDAGADVILMEIPRGFIRDGYRSLERQLARQHQLPLIPDSTIRRLVLWSPYAPPGMWIDQRHHLSDDGLHPNDAGNRALARTVATALVGLYGPSVLAGEPANQTPK